METKEEKRINIFIGHSVIDKDGAKDFKDLFVELGKDLYELRDESFNSKDVFCHPILQAIKEKMINGERILRIFWLLFPFSSFSNP